MHAQIARFEAQHATDQDSIDSLRTGRLLDREMITTMEAANAVDRGVIAQLELDGIIDRDTIVTLELALTSVRRIGAAVGIVMAVHTLTEEQAFQVLSQASRDRSIRLRDIAEQVLLTGTIGDHHHDVSGWIRCSSFWPIG